jgi:hypothetical protein
LQDIILTADRIGADQVETLGVIVCLQHNCKYQALQFMEYRTLDLINLPPKHLPELANTDCNRRTRNLFKKYEKQLFSSTCPGTPILH